MTAQDGAAQNGTGQDGAGQNGTGQDGAGQNGTGQDGAQNGARRNGAGRPAPDVRLLAELDAGLLEPARARQVRSAAAEDPTATVSGRISFDRRNVYPTFMSEGTVPNERRPRVERAIGHLAHESRSSTQLLQALGCEHLVSEFQLQVGNHRAKVYIAASLAVSVDRSLHLYGSRRHCGERVGNRHVSVVMAMNAERYIYFFNHVAEWHAQHHWVNCRRSYRRARSAVRRRRRPGEDRRAGDSR